MVRAGITANASAVGEEGAEPGTLPNAHMTTKGVGGGGSWGCSPTPNFQICVIHVLESDFIQRLMNSQLSLNDVIKKSDLTLIPLGYFEDLSPLGGGGGCFGPPLLRSRQLMDRLT